MTDIIDAIQDPKHLTRRQKDKAATSAKIAKAATVIFRKVGYEAGTIRDIATAAGMSTGAVFSNYTDKEELFAATMGRKPTPEAQGHKALVLLRALVSADITEGDYVDQLAAIDRLRAHAVLLIDAGGLPELPADQILDPDEHSLVDVMEAAIGERL